MSRALILTGLLLVAIGLAWPWLRQLPFGRLPGDIIIERDNFRFYFPVTTSIIVSVVLSLLFLIFRR